MADIAKYIDHTILKPLTTEADIEKLCDEAIHYGFVAVCIPPYYIALAKKLLEETSIKIATVVGFPFGYNSVDSKLQEIKDAIAAGADELDMVHTIAAVKNADWPYLENEIAACTQLVHKKEKKIKVIIESGELTDAEILKCCKLYRSYHPDFLKTSTGYAATGATVHAVNLMRNNLPADIAIKASGGIRTFDFAKELIAAGAKRIGCSASVEILKASKHS